MNLNLLHHVMLSKDQFQQVLLVMGALFDLKWEQLDVKIAFLHSESEEQIYKRQPKEFIISGKEDHVYLLKKSLYGLKQSSR